MKLNLACGKNKLPGWFNVDISRVVEPDACFDLLKFPWDFADESIEEIFCSHFVEHIGDELIDFMDEAYRVLRPGGSFLIRCPYYTSIRAWQDPTHKRPISEFLFYYFNLEQRRKLGVDHYPIKSDFEIGELRYHYPEELKDCPEEERSWLRVHAWNTVADIEVLLRKNDPNQQGVDRQTNSLVQ
jgi:SAM-dependent methyltransferase